MAHRRPHSTQNHKICAHCHQPHSAKALLSVDVLHSPLKEQVCESCDSLASAYICMSCLDTLRMNYIEQELAEEGEELLELTQAVSQSLNSEETTSQNIYAEFDQNLTLGQRIADRIAEFGGSWWFLSSFACFIVLWIALNIGLVILHPFDPYPFILLNLILSCLASIQAPIIMMSQNRMESRDRLRSESDYRVNLKAELEIRHLHAKLDLLLTKHWKRLVQIQKIQTDMLQQLLHQHHRP